MISPSKWTFLGYFWILDKPKWGNWICKHSTYEKILWICVAKHCICFFGTTYVMYIYILYYIYIIFISYRIKYIISNILYTCYIIYYFTCFSWAFESHSILLDLASFSNFWMVMDWLGQPPVWDKPNHTTIYNYKYTYTYIYIYIIHIHYTYTLYIYIIHIHYTYTLYIYIIHIHYTYTFYIYIIHIHYTYTLYIYIIHYTVYIIHYTYTLYIYIIHIHYTYTLYIYIIQYTLYSIH